MLSMTAAATQHATVGPFVINVTNRHPAVLARMASTLQIASGGRSVTRHVSVTLQPVDQAGTPLSH